MKGFVITALTDHGTNVLDQQIQEGKIEIAKKSLLERIKFHKIWIRETTRNPLTDSWQIYPDAVRLVNIDLDQVVAEVDRSMLENGAERGIDYDVEVTNE